MMYKIGIGNKKLGLYRFLGSYLWFTLFIVLLVLYAALLNRHFPRIAGDYFYLYDQLTVGNWHLAEQGLSPFYYSPYFCGGGVIYGQPDHAFYSLLQFSSYLVGFWKAVNLTMLVSLAIGYWGWFLVGRNVLLMDRKWSHLFSIIVLTNGFYINNVVAGHWNFFTTPLIGWMLWCLFDRHEDGVRSLLLRAGIFSLVSGWIIYSGNYAVYLLWIALALFLIPFDIFISRQWVTRRLLLLLARGFVCGLGALVITSSKLYAIYLYMQVYPRNISLSFWSFPDNEAMKYVLNSFFGYLMPHYPIWFYTVQVPGFVMFLSPMVIVGMLCAVWLGGRALRRNNWNGFALLLITFYIYFALSGALLFISSDDNQVVNFVHNLPIFSSLRGYFRYLFALSIPIVMVAVWALYQSMNKLNKRWQAVFILGGVVVTLLTFFIYNGRTVDYYMTNDWRVRDFQPVAKVEEGIRNSGGFLAPVDRVILDWNNFETGSSGVKCADGLALFEGDNSLQVKALAAGLVTESNNGYYNMMKPACILYPKENNCQPGDRIPLSDTDNLHRFRHGMKTDWRISNVQSILNRLSIVWLALCVTGLLFGGVYYLVHRASLLLSGR